MYWIMNYRSSILRNKKFLKCNEKTFHTDFRLIDKAIYVAIYVCTLVIIAYY